jgi:hypothetical protein
MLGTQKLYGTAETVCFRHRFCCEEPPPPLSEDRAIIARLLVQVNELELLL